MPALILLFKLYSQPPTLIQNNCLTRRRSSSRHRCLTKSRRNAGGDGGRKRMEYLEGQKTMLASPTGAFAKKRVFRWRTFVRRNLSAYLFLLPALLAFTFFVWYPIVL